MTPLQLHTHSLLPRWLMCLSLAGLTWRCLQLIWYWDDAFYIINHAFSNGHLSQVGSPQNLKLPSDDPHFRIATTRTVSGQPPTTGLWIEKAYSALYLESLTFGPRGDSVKIGIWWLKDPPLPPPTLVRNRLFGDPGH